MSSILIRGPRMRGASWLRRDFFFLFFAPGRGRNAISNHLIKNQGFPCPRSERNIVAARPLLRRGYVTVGLVRSSCCSRALGGRGCAAPGIAIPAAAAGISAIKVSARSRRSAVVAAARRPALTRPAEKREVFGHDGQTRALLSILARPLIELQPAFDQDRLAFGHVLVDCFALSSESGDVHEAHVLMLIAVLVAPA